MSLYRELRWDEAMALFAQCLLLRPDDRPSALMERRCRISREQPAADGLRSAPDGSPQVATSPATTACIASLSFAFASALHCSLVALGKAS